MLQAEVNVLLRDPNVLNWDFNGVATSWVSSMFGPNTRHELPPLTEINESIYLRQILANTLKTVEKYQYQALVKNRNPTIKSIMVRTFYWIIPNSNPNNCMLCTHIIKCAITFVTSTYLIFLFLVKTWWQASVLQVLSYLVPWFSSYHS